MTGDESFLLDESVVLEFLTDCEVPVESTATTTDVSATGACDVISWQEKGEVASAKETTQWKKMSLAATDSTSSGNSSTTSKTAETALRKRSWRQGRKAEMLQLRELVKQLSAQLEGLKKTAGVLSTLPSTTRHGAVTSSQPSRFEAKPACNTEAASLWEHLAARQSKKRELAQLENPSLREALRHQKRQTRTLQRSIKRRLQNQATTNAIELCKRHRLDCRQADRPSNNEDIFRQLIAEVDESYATLDSVFVKVKMQELPCPGRRNLTSSCRTAGVFAEFVDCHVLPFDARQTGRLLWRLLATNEFKGPDAIFEDVSTLNWHEHCHLYG
ncbi:hypothetical protein BBJ28_00002069 [Nothophytophthora sp. Chile5]|nr:hypothetical protein BBJ28_00002069 [Nothophytophthora sp. Chile5]